MGSERLGCLACKCEALGYHQHSICASKLLITSFINRAVLAMRITKTNTHEVKTTYSVATDGAPQTTVASSQMYTDTFVVNTAYY